jgi:hypothetical protein
MRDARRVGVRDTLSTNPLPTGSTATGKTIGIITVARFRVPNPLPHDHNIHVVHHRQNRPADVRCGPLTEVASTVRSLGGGNK